MPHVSQYVVTDPAPITAARFFEMLSVMPPARWYRGDHIEWFHVCEFLTGDLVAWFARIGERYYEFNDNFNLPKERLIDKIVKADKAAEKRAVP
jgi:hypothetical protein